MEHGSGDTETIPRRILVVCRTFLPKEGGIEEYAYNRCLQDPKQVVVLTASQPGDRAFDAAQPFPIHRWPMPHWPLLGPLNSLLKQLVNLIYSLVMAVSLYRQYRFEAVEWGHGYDFPSLLLLSYLVPAQCVMYLHGNDLLCPLKNPLFWWFFQWTLHRCRIVVCNSQFTCDYLTKRFAIAAPTRTSVINPTVRPSKFGLSDGHLGQSDWAQSGWDNVDQTQRRTVIRQQHHIPDSAIVILSVGRLVERKGFDRVIELMPQLLADGVDVHYIICGRGPMMGQLQQLATQKRVGDRVHFAGFVSDQQLADYYAACDVFSMITFFNQKAACIEGFGIVYLEAGYFAKPVIAARVGGVPDAVKHESTGLLVDPGSEVETYQALRRLCQDGSLRQQLGRRGRELACAPTPHRTIYGQGHKE